VSVIECIPNVSEGRDTALIEACRRAIGGAGAALLDVHADPDHNRSVFTLAGGPEPVARAIMALVDVAVAGIDLCRQSGVHPRMGAIDVIPLVPLTGARTADCVALARSVGAAMAERHGLPVFLYAAAATCPARLALENVRRGGFEGLAAQMATPEGAPDFGPRQPHPTAGATAVGVRGPLVAFNVVLDSDRLDIARDIARSVREKNGGLSAVKALGLPLASRGLVQVSMNLVDFRITPPVVAFERVREEAERRRVRVAGSELVGLIPRAALPDQPATRLMWPSFRESVILEHQLEQHGLGSSV
jgi:glutamate formiminotransferase